MVETLGNLKNSNSKRNATQNQGGEAVERLKKFLTALSKKKHGKAPPDGFSISLAHSICDTVVAYEPLRITLSDLHSAESKGKWWLVGAAWNGDPLAERQQQQQQQSQEMSKTPATSSEDSLIKLARKQGMNSDIRRSVFVVLMSSDVLSFSPPLFDY
jgi:nucleolar MIF4G domain-containing protein 1